MLRPERKEDRIATAVPVRLEGGAEGLTRDISPSGVYFVIGTDVAQGQSIQFSLEFDNSAGKFYLECRGEIVRVEKADRQVGVAARIVESRLERRDVLASTETLTGA